MKISASICSCQRPSRFELVRELDQFAVDYLHLDCRDDVGIFDEIEELRRYTSTRMDLHLITSRPEEFVPRLQDHDVELASFQYEALRGPLMLPDDLRTSVGLAITSQTPIDAFEPFAERCDFVLFMTTTPGVSGGTFDQDTFRRIGEFRARFPNKRVHVDGGVDDQVSLGLRKAGTDCAVSGSYLVGAMNIPAALWRLRGRSVEALRAVEDIMTPLHDLPLVAEEHSADVERILRAMSDSRLGFCLIVDRRQALVGVVSDGDLRRVVLRAVSRREELDASQLINFAPLTLSSRATVQEMFDLVRAQDRTILFLPVTDAAGRLKGAVTFSGLTQGRL